MKDEILKSIDEIENVTLESEMAVCHAMLDMYDKMEIIAECYEGESLDMFTIYQEGFADDVKSEMKKSGQGKSTAMKLISALPRLITAIIKSLKKKPVDSKRAERAAANAKNMTKEQRIAHLNQLGILDEKGKSAKGGKLFKVLMTLGALGAGGTIAVQHVKLKDAKDEAKVYKTKASDLEKQLLNKDEELSNMLHKLESAEKIANNQDQVRVLKRELNYLIDKNKALQDKYSDALKEHQVDISKADAEIRDLRRELESYDKRMSKIFKTYGVIIDNAKLNDFAKRLLESTNDEALDYATHGDSDALAGPSISGADLKKVREEIQKHAIAAHENGEKLKAAVKKYDDCISKYGKAIDENPFKGKEFKINDILDVSFNDDYTHFVFNKELDIDAFLHNITDSIENLSEYLVKLVSAVKNKQNDAIDRGITRSKLNPSDRGRAHRSYTIDVELLSRKFNYASEAISKALYSATRDSYRLTDDDYTWLEEHHHKQTVVTNLRSTCMALEAEVAEYNAFAAVFEEIFNIYAVIFDSKTRIGARSMGKRLPNISKDAADIKAIDYKAAKHGVVDKDHQDNHISFTL